jgi:hypothetical protein
MGQDSQPDSGQSCACLIVGQSTSYAERELRLHKVALSWYESTIIEPGRDFEVMEQSSIEGGRDDRKDV